MVEARFVAILHLLGACVVPLPGVPMRMLSLFPPLFLLLAGIPAAQPSARLPLNLMPMPSNYQLGNGQLSIDQSFSIALAGYREARLEGAAQRFLRNLALRTGIPLRTQLAAGDSATLVIQTDHKSKDVQEPGEDESYSLEVTATAAILSAPNPLGALHGLQTFLQLVESTPSGFAVPVITIHDTPRFVWRGLMIDVARHYIPLEVLRRNIDGMEAVKLNVLHLHLSDNQGFRVESKKFPRLHEMGSDGLFYTQDEIRALIAYTRDRGIRVVPEFDMPGHSTSWFVGYPDLASLPGPYQIERHWGVFDPAIDPSNERTYKFLEEFIGEMAKLFPDAYFHIGGDEVNGKQWDANAKIEAFKREHGFNSNEALQAYFTNRVQKIVSKQHKTMVGWDEILTPEAAKDIVIQSWRGPESLAAAAKRGYRCMLSNGYYIDLMWSAERHYLIEPLSGDAAHLSAEEKARILGGEATMWSEYVDAGTIDSRIWPRTAAIAERFWSPQEVRDVGSMYQRLSQISWRMDRLGLTHNTGYVPMLQRIANAEDTSALRALADVVEPVKDYTRAELASSEPSSATPLNRLVDAARPESDVARIFSRQADSFVDGGCRDIVAATSIRSTLDSWRDQAAALQPQFEKSQLLKETEPLSRNLSAAGTAGLQALDYLSRGERAPDSWRAEQTALLEKAKKPDSAQLLLMPLAAVQKLIEAAATACH
jgi:hexosaminidase